MATLAMTYRLAAASDSYQRKLTYGSPQIRKAEEICRKAGVESELMDGCIFDVGQTGDASASPICRERPP
jgi:hypothetical protein